MDESSIAHLMKRASRFLCLFCLSIVSAEGAALDTNRIEQITGLKGAWNAAGHEPALGASCQVESIYALIARLNLGRNVNTS